MKPDLENVEYISGKVLFENCPCITIGDTNAFVKIVDIYKPKVIYVTNRCFYFDKNGELVKSQYGGDKNYTEFRFVHQNTCYAAVGWNYRSLSDFMEGEANGFKTGDEYNAAKERGFSSNRDYHSCPKQGLKIA